MSWPDYALLLAAGVAAGVCGTVTGIGSVFSYPALLATGLPALSANVTNTLSLALGFPGGIYSSRPELGGQASRAWRLALACALGSALGAALLLISPPGIFEKVVPFLVAAASAAILLPRPHPTESQRVEQSRLQRRTLLATVAVSIYNGYFAAAGGVLIIAVLLATTSWSFRHINALKNVLIVASDVAAAIAYASFGPVSWPALPPLVIGLLLGAWLGPAIARRLPPDKLRYGIALAGLALGIKLGLDAY